MSDEAQVIPNLIVISNSPEGREKLEAVGSTYLLCRVRDHEITVRPLTLAEELSGGYITLVWAVSEADLRGCREPLTALFDERLVLLVKELKSLGKSEVSDARVKIWKSGATITFEFWLVVPGLMPGERIRLGEISSKSSTEENTCKSSSSS